MPYSTTVGTTLYQIPGPDDCCLGHRPHQVRQRLAAMTERFQLEKSSSFLQRVERLAIEVLEQADLGRFAVG